MRSLGMTPGCAGRASEECAVHATGWKADDRYEQRADSAKEAEREVDEGSAEAQRADHEEVVGEEEGVPEDESLPPRGGATCPHPHRGGGQIENIV